MRICIRPGISIEPVLITVKIKFFDAIISAYGRETLLRTPWHYANSIALIAEKQP